MTSKKIYIVLIIALVVFFVVMFTTFGTKKIREDKYTSTIIVGDDTVWTYSNKQWLNIRSLSSIEKFNWEKFRVYSNNSPVGDYLMWHDDRDGWYVFDEEKNAIVVDGSLLAINSNYNIKVLEFSEDDNVDMGYVRTVLEDNDLSVSSQFTSLYKVDVDFDSDGVEEEFYVMSNVFALDFNPNQLFSIVFMVKNEQIYYIYNNVTRNKSFNSCKPYFNTFLDVDNDNNYEFILSCGKYGNSKSVDMLYKFDENAFKIVISNQ